MIMKFILRLKNKDSKFMHVSSFKDNQLLPTLVILASWTGRYEAHLWDKNCWNESQNKKGRQGAYDDEEAAAQRQTASLLVSRVTTFKIVPRGTEGALSVEGTVAGLLASILLSFVGYLMGEGGRPRVADFVHGSDGLGNISLPPPKSKKIEKTASEFLVDMVSKYPGEVSILALGPLTNFALAMKRDSSFARKVKRVVILGGSFFALGNVNPAAEANVSDYHLYNTFSYSIWYEPLAHILGREYFIHAYDLIYALSTDVVSSLLALRREAFEDGIQATMIFLI
ncbi:hypothetical protein TEA_006964 [Camellia sinensis var. sinensis]|uniref:Inosine/uridine-preferring nucleoside hydrolase domain-containing protein n=1 Tax=Camellia sinensis var. sinensis TaxID=542762 RepID=A0A4S4E0T4_CAMSN|nr:hypothetical protein TEA_006964 [Camellia sinensis var. sinensis]